VRSNARKFSNNKVSIIGSVTAIHLPKHSVLNNRTMDTVQKPLIYPMFLMTFFSENDDFVKGKKLCREEKIQ
jgi:hypothetical protein